jgi:rhamnose transport system permease protein
MSLVLAVLFGLLLHATTLGRRVFMIGTNREAASFSGVNVSQVTLIIFTLSGLASAAAALMLVSRVGSVRSDLATGEELAVITAVILGGANIFGGSGSILGTVLAVLAVGSLIWGMGLANATGQTQQAAVGALLVLSILIPHLVARLSAALTRRVARADGGVAARKEGIGG